MTAIVGILCEDGVVVGTDSSATFSTGQERTIEQKTEKLKLVGNCIIIAGTGQVGLGQRFEEIVQKAFNAKEFNNSAIEIAKKLSRSTIDDFASTHVQRGQYGALVAFPSDGKFQLCEFAVADFQPEFKTEKMWYASLGITQHVTDSFLVFMREVFWTGGLPNLSQGIFATTWVLDHAIQVNAGGVNGPVRMAVLQNNNGQIEAKVLSQDELGEHRQNIKGAKDALRDYCKGIQEPSEETTLKPLVS